MKDHNARFKRNKTRVTGKDGTGGKLLRQMDGRIKQAAKNKDTLKVLKNRHTGISVTPGGADSLKGSERLLCTELPSPGDSRKLILAKGFLRQPKFIILDEPTNHIDLPSIQCLETCLSDLSCGMIMVSPDEAFINRMRPEILEFQRADSENNGVENFMLVRA